jgi:hypothetical protein
LVLDPVVLQRLEGGMLPALSLLLFWKHSGAWLLPGLLAIVGLLAGASPAGSIALIWFGHIGVDRLLGYGPKLPTASRTRIWDASAGAADTLG